MVDIKNSFSEFLIDELEEHLPKPRVKNVKTLLKRKVANKKDLDELKENIKTLKQELPEDFYDYLWDEIDEIEFDLKWKNSKNGKSILLINKWLKGFNSEMRKMSEFEEVIIGGHTEKEAVVVLGEVGSKEALEKLKEFITSKKPPFETIYEVQINA